MSAWETSPGTVWSNSGPKLVKPDGTSENVDEITADMLVGIARDFGLRKFLVVKDGAIISAGQTDLFPITSGVVEVREYNEAKIWVV